MAALLAGAQHRCEAAVYTVTTTSDSGTGSLRQAITFANTNANLDTIQFSISGGGPYSIRPQSELPAITEPVIISATNQTGYSSHPVVELRGSNAGTNSHGLYIVASGCTVRGLAINRFSLSGILIEGATSNVIQGNFIGTDTAGKIGYGNGEAGITIAESSNNLIGGTNALQRNVISGPNLTGIYITGILSTGNQIKGNYIGTDITGANAFASLGPGVIIDGATANIIGGTTAAERNVISGNAGAGILIANIAASNNIVCGNFIGTTATGLSGLGNAEDGITIVGAPGNTIGGTNSGAGNLISANLQRGIQITETNSTDNLVLGNLIGTDVTGKLNLANQTNGVAIIAGRNNVIGGTAPQARNVISGNLDSGVYLTGAETTGNRVEGNFIGVDITGTNALGNAYNGVVLDSGNSNIIGGAVSGAGNVISGNTNYGVYITSNTNEEATVEQAFGIQIQGNFIGVDATGKRALSNNLSGVWIETFSNVVGGASATQRNVISGNGQDGITLADTNAIGNRILGNYIGLDVTGTNALGNELAGVAVVEAPNNIIGGASPGEGNVISGNWDAGVALIGTNCTANVVLGNRIGTDATGTKDLGNDFAGVQVGQARNNIIGGAVPGEGNIISGNEDAGVYLKNSTGNVIAGNRIGTDINGTMAIGNSFEGLYLRSAGTNQIGGPTPAHGNLISGNHSRGILATNSSHNVFANNFIGTAADGVTAIPNAFHGIELEPNSDNNLIGGTGAGNRIAFAPNVYAGVRIRAGAVNNAVLDNSIFSNGPNGGLGIDLGDFGVDTTDACDGDSGANLKQNYPILMFAFGGAKAGIMGTLDSSPNTTYELQFFASPSCNPSGYGEGKTFLGGASLVAGGSCNNPFTVTLNTPVSPGSVITATATDPAGNTSEFSACTPVLPPPELTISQTNDNQLALVWPATMTTAFKLKQTESLASPVVWTDVTNSTTVNNGLKVVILSYTTTNRFFSLVLE